MLKKKMLVLNLPHWKRYNYYTFKKSIAKNHKAFKKV